MEIDDVPMRLVPKKKITVTITDERILRYFENNSWINPEKFVEKQMVDIILNETKTVNSSSTEEVIATTTNINNMTENDMKQFYKEYTTFLTEQKNIVNTMKDNIKSLENIRFNHIDEVLSKTFDIKKNTHMCNICNTRNFRNLKALSTHQRKCKRDNEIKENETGINEECLNPTCF